MVVYFKGPPLGDATSIAGSSRSRWKVHCRPKAMFEGKKHVELMLRKGFDQNQA